MGRAIVQCRSGRERQSTTRPPHHLSAREPTYSSLPLVACAQDKRGFPGHMP